MKEQLISEKILNRIYGHGKGWVFSSKDFMDLGDLDTINRTLQRLYTKERIHRVMRGIYDYPRFSSFLNETIPPSVEEVAQAISRAHGWTVSASGNAALNILGVSTQVPAVWEFITDGPSRTYSWPGGKIHFIRRANKETTILSFKTALVVQGLKALGESYVNSDVIRQLKNALSPEERKKALKEAKYATAWIYEVIREVAKAERDSDA